MFVILFSCRCFSVRSEIIWDLLFGTIFYWIDDMNIPNEYISKTEDIADQVRDQYWYQRRHEILHFDDWNQQIWWSNGTKCSSYGWFWEMSTSSFRFKNVSLSILQSFFLLPPHTSDRGDHGPMDNLRVNDFWSGIHRKGHAAYLKQIIRNAVAHTLWIESVSPTNTITLSESLVGFFVSIFFTFTSETSESKRFTVARRIFSIRIISSFMESRDFFSIDSVCGVLNFSVFIRFRRINF